MTFKSSMNHPQKDLFDATFNDLPLFICADREISAIYLTLKEFFFHFKTSKSSNYSLMLHILLVQIVPFFTLFLFFIFRLRFSVSPSLFTHGCRDCR